MDDYYDFLGVGAGPANLSLAALNHGRAGLRGLLFDAQPAGRPWHEGLLLAESRLQTHFFKDLVTPVDPTSSLSFAAYLVTHRRLYKFITADFPQISRVEFSHYLGWVAQQLGNVRHNAPVESVIDAGDTWQIKTQHGTYQSSNLVVATGRTPQIPDFALGKLGPTVFHASEFCHMVDSWQGRRVAIVGGGQSAAEIFNHILADRRSPPQKLHLISRRSNLLPLDDSPFVNEWFMPDYSSHFQQLPQDERAQHIAAQRMASDGVSIELLNDIYRRMYELRYLAPSKPSVAISVSSTVCDINTEAQGHRLTIRDGRGHFHHETFDIVILGTGYSWRLPPFLRSIAHLIRMDGSEPALEADYSAHLTQGRGKRLYFQNSARLQRGVADPNLSLLAWRSAKILNSMTGHDLYDLGDSPCMFDLPSVAERQKTALEVLPHAI